MDAPGISGILAPLFGGDVLLQMYGTPLAPIGIGLARAGFVSVVDAEIDGVGVLVHAIVVDQDRAVECDVAIDIGERTISYDCSCAQPQCAHAVGVLAVLAGEDLAGPLPGSPVEPLPPWRRLLDRVVPSADASAEGEPLALFVGVVDRPPSYGYRPAGRALCIRPAVRGARGSWIRSGVSWSGSARRA